MSSFKYLSLLTRPWARFDLARAGLATATLCVVACSSSEPPAQMGSEHDPLQDDCPVVVSDTACDTTQRPIVFVHGTFGSGDQFANAAMLFGSNGYCQDRIVAVEYNSVSFGADQTEKIDAVVNDILAKTGQTQVELLGHSQGTGHCIDYLSDPARAAKVAHYINLSGTEAIPAGVHALSISSMNDIGAMPRHSPGAEQEVTFQDEDHVEVSASTKSFVEIYKYLLGKDPQYTEIQCGEPEIEIEGIAETFGDNEPIVDGVIEVYELGDEPRERGEPLFTIHAQASGYTGIVKLQRLVAYEFRALGADGKLIGHVYFAPFKRSNRLTRFLSPSTNPLVAGITTDMVVTSANHSVLVARAIQGTFRHDLGQTLTIDGKEILTDDNAGRTMTTTGLFMADQNKNGQTELGAAFSAPFVVGTDAFMQAKEPAFLELVWNGTTLRIPNWPSDEGLMTILLP